MLGGVVSHSRLVGGIIAHGSGHVLSSVNVVGFFCTANDFRRFFVPVMVTTPFTFPLDLRNTHTHTHAHTHTHTDITHHSWPTSVLPSRTLCCGLDLGCGGAQHNPQLHSLVEPHTSRPALQRTTGRREAQWRSGHPDTDGGRRQRPCSRLHGTNVSFTTCS